ncbi:hypothetical protein SCP_0111590 [Sparassis crispa]|uniref:Elongator complex protein 5 n=1 Tax=Sparassis crispa TaxID=139825 RepID=A0A401G7X7_9APHY|nr:hypothetical protein SCP_0111590 [Sparassis crispa]GBE78276.1 hypothetical protein SCP_0111590 [Sparassis crispa]
MPLLSSTLSSSSRQPFVLLQSSIAQSCLPVLSYITNQAALGSGTTLLFCFLYPPLAFADQPHEQLRVFDWTEHIPGYSEDTFEARAEILSALRSAPQGLLSVIIDSVDTLLSDVGSLAKTHLFLSEIYATIRARSSPSRLVLHVLGPSPIIPILTQTKFSPTLAHITAHPSVLLTHIASEYLTPPPPASPPEKFWRVFLPIAERYYESEKLVFGQDGEGCGGRDFVVEVLVRGADGSGRRRGVERVLEGWADSRSCDLTGLESLKSLWTRKAAEESGPDPTQNLSFNLNLTPQQQHSRAQVPLPYAHEGKPSEHTAMLVTQGAILYDPDSADDIDDDDPDEDLDI